MTHYFYTPGTMQRECFTIMGLNVKPNNNNPIGYFGTGLKYAIAVVLRLGGSISIKTPEYTAHFSTESGIFRGSDYTKIVAVTQGTRGIPQRETLPFTLDYGKNWLPWMAYRELYTNTLDEGGSIESPLDGPQTVIAVDLAAFDEVVENFDKYFITRDWLENHSPSGDEIVVFEHPTLSGAIFCKGIRVFHVPTASKYCVASWEKARLTEDRTLQSMDYFETLSTENLIMGSTNKEFIREQALQSGFGTFYPSGQTFTEVYADTIREIYRSSEKLPYYVFEHAVSKGIIPDAFEKCDLSDEFISRLQEANLHTVKLGYDILDFEYSGTSELFSPGTGAVVKRGHIYFREKELMQYSIPKLAAILLEEMVHARHGYSDCTREMQNFLFEQWIAQVCPPEKEQKELPFDDEIPF